jgi:hypothetical protein
LDGGLRVHKDDATRLLMDFDAEGAVIDGSVGHDIRGLKADLRMSRFSGVGDKLNDGPHYCGCLVVDVGLVRGRSRASGDASLEMVTKGCVEVRIANHVPEEFTELSQTRAPLNTKCLHW